MMASTAQRVKSGFLPYSHLPTVDPFSFLLLNKGMEQAWPPQPHPVLELVGIFVLLLVEVDKVVGDSFQVGVLHGPGDAKGVTSDVVDLDAVGGGQQLHDPFWCGSCRD